jgi:hypothetical protein
LSLFKRLSISRGEWKCFFAALIAFTMISLLNLRGRPIYQAALCISEGQRGGRSGRQWIYRVGR